MSERAYHFKFQITDATTGEVVEADWCSPPPESLTTDRNAVVDTHVYQMLRNWNKFARAEYEAALDMPANEYVRDNAQFGVGA